MNSKEIARQLIFNHSISASLVNDENAAEVIEYLQIFGLHLFQIGQSFVTFSFTPILHPTLEGKWYKFLRELIENKALEQPIFSAEQFDPNFLQELLSLKYVELQHIPPDLQCIEYYTLKSLGHNEESVVFTSRLFEELGKGIICDACQEVGGFMVRCGCGKKFHIECCRELGSCCTKSDWGELLNSWSFESAPLEVEAVGDPNDDI